VVESLLGCSTDCALGCFPIAAIIKCDWDGWSTWMRPDVASLRYPRSMNSCSNAFSRGSRFLFLLEPLPEQYPEPSEPGSEELQKPRDDMK
jgi:hypothetical protein